ncbi:MAG TPA: MMPL family transporter [Verrucomicrobiae bacterium]|nr:MMPL family transporter [Verrucomicrobiae bacterium]
MTHRFRPLLWLVCLALIVVGLLRLRFDVEVLNLLPGEVPAVQGLKIYQEHFANARELVITIQANDPDQAENAARAIAERLRLKTNLVAEATWQPPWLENPGQSAELIAYLWLNQPPQIFSSLTNRFDPSQLSQTLAATREQLATSMSPGEIGRLSYDPFGLTQLPESTANAAPSFGQGQELFSSSDGTFRIVFVQATEIQKSYRDSLKWFDAIKNIVAEVRADQSISPEVQVSYTGGPAFVSEISSGMQSDLTKSVGSTVVIIVLLFWWAHRRFKPLLWLLALLALVLCGTLASGGLIFGTVNVVSVGFAAILLGLAVDYGLVLYHEALHAGITDFRTIRRMLAPSILWSAVTTSGAFLILNFGGLPGLAQLGSLVAIGVLLAAIVMLNFFLPPLLRGKMPQVGEAKEIKPASLQTQSTLGWIITGTVTLAALIILSQTRPVLDHSTNSLRPKSSPAYSAMEQIKTHLARAEEPDWLLVAGTNESELIRKLEAVQPILTRAVSNGQLQQFTLPLALLPRPENQAANRSTAEQLASHRDAVLAAATSNGFTSNSIVFTENVFSAWNKMADANSTVWPTNPLSRWIFDKVTARDATNIYALGLVYSTTNSANVDAHSWSANLPRDGVWLAGWSRLGSDLLNVVEHDFWRVLLPMTVLLLVSLWLAFRRITEVILSLATLILSGLCLWAFMGVLGWSWNLLNLLALPLLLGAGVDYSIHLQLALRRHRGNISETRRTIGRALLLCAGTTVAGFGSNAFSSNAGLASLGLVCAAGIAFAFLTSYFLLPVWWKTFASSDSTISSLPPTEIPPSGSAPLATPSSLYRSEFWRAGLWIVRIVPRRLCLFIAHIFAGIYWLLARSRRETVIENLLPALNHNRAEAVRKARALIHQFAVKIVDLWLYEAGAPIQQLLGEASGWEHFEKAQREKRGVLLITPHLGNWEFGGPWLTPRGVTLQVITLAEPGQTFTQLRQASRARWNIETLVIGNDPFAFLEIIKRLESGATVALLVDRPPPPTAIEVELFGKPFAASISAAELARASGCTLLPVYIPRSGDAYAAHILPPIEYDRASLRDRANRQKLTQEIINAFAPAIRQHLDQWYHFVPIWPPSNKS